MKKFQDAVAAIAQALPLWEQPQLTQLTKKQREELNAVQKNLNEAQTCQAIILRLLDAAGYDIWNPFEVFPEKSSGKEIPDFTIFFEEEPRVIIEAKFFGKDLGKELNREMIQATRYIRILRLRWAILTNGKQWIFLDDYKAKPGAVSAEVALVLNLLEPREGEFLGILLNRQLWEAEGADERVAEKVQLISIAMKVSKILHEKRGIKHDKEGVKIVIEVLLGAEDRPVALDNLSQITELLFPQNTPLVEIPAAPITQRTPQATEESLNVWQVLYEQLEAAQQKSRTDISKMKDFYTIQFNEYQINISSMGNLCEAFGETCLKLKLSEALTFIPEQDRKPTISYRLLSNHQYISVHYSFDNAVKRFFKKLFKTIGLPEGSVTISSNDNGIHVLP